MLNMLPAPLQAAPSPADGGAAESRPETDVAALQGMAFSVAMNSKRSNAIVALLIASNFAEIKGVVLKRFDPRRLLVLSFQVRACTKIQ
jgi:Eukaryotic membrane protein family